MRHFNEVPSIFRNYFMSNNKLNDFKNRDENNVHGYPIKTAYYQRMIRYTRLNVRKFASVLFALTVITFRNKLILLTAQIA